VIRMTGFGRASGHFVRPRLRRNQVRHNRFLDILAPPGRLVVDAPSARRDRRTMPRPRSSINLGVRARPSRSICRREARRLRKTPALFASNHRCRTFCCPDLFVVPVEDISGGRGPGQTHRHEALLSHAKTRKGKGRAWRRCSARLQSWAVRRWISERAPLVPGGGPGRLERVPIRATAADPARLARVAILGEVGHYGGGDPPRDNSNRRPIGRRSGRRSADFLLQEMNRKSNDRVKAGDIESGRCSRPSRKSKIREQIQNIGERMCHKSGGGEAVRRRPVRGWQDVAPSRERRPAGLKHLLTRRAPARNGRPRSGSSAGRMMSSAGRRSSVGGSPRKSYGTPEDGIRPLPPERT
jgi:hypothetical protein